MRCLTHPFAHAETLDKARRWLIHAGISPDRIHAHHHGMPRLTVVAEPGEMQSIEMIIRIAELNDPEGLPGFWDLARLKTDGPPTPSEEMATGTTLRCRPSFPLAWRAIDEAGDEALRTEIERQKEFRESRA